MQRLERSSGERVEMTKLAGWILSTSTFGFALLRDGKVTVANAAWQNYEREDGSVWIARKTKERYGNLTEAAAQQALDMQRDLVQVLRLKRVETRQFIDLHVERVFEDGTTAVAIVVDASRRARQERTIQRTRRLRAMSALAQPIAHEMNNTLQALSLRLKMLERAWSPTTGIAAFDGAQDGIQKALELVARLRDFADLRPPRGPNVAIPAEIVQRSTEIVRAEIEAQKGRPFEFTASIGKVPAVAVAPSDALGILTALLMNAHAATPAGGKVRVSVRERENRVEIRVTDDGPRIPPADLERIFDPFFTTTERRNPPLGLAAAWATATRAGGRIRAANLKRGGVAFTVDFPATVAAALQTRAGAIALRILLVDDDPRELERSADLLRAEGHAVDVAAGGRRALELLATKIPWDVVVSDLYMPGTDGWAA